MKNLLILSIFILLSSCTENSWIKNWGGEGQIQLPQGKKLVNVTWKGDEVWYLVRDMKQDEFPEKYEFHEKSSFGMLEGTYIIVESR